MAILIRDEKTIYNSVKTPAVVFDKDLGVLLKIGDYSEMEKYYEITTNIYKERSLNFMVESLILLELPKDQDIVDKVFQNTGYLKSYYEKHFTE